jgi:hypothetical protein
MLRKGQGLSPRREGQNIPANRTDGRVDSEFSRAFVGRDTEALEPLICVKAMNISHATRLKGAIISNCFQHQVENKEIIFIAI